jgi:hypothetical protein
VIQITGEPGLAVACNQGIAAAQGEVVVLVGEDVVATLGWLSGLVRHLDDRHVGVVVPATDRSAGDPDYTSYGGLLQFAFRRRDQLEGATPRDVRVADVACAALRRDALEELGPLDERSNGGALTGAIARLRAAGYRIACAEEVFLHPFGAVEPELGGNGSAAAAARKRRAREIVDSRRQTTEALARTLKRVEEVEARVASAAERAARVEQIALGSRRRDSVDAALRVEAAVRRHVPSGSTVVVVGDGDGAPERLEGNETWRFPKLGNGHGRAGDDAITTLERLRERGAEYLVLPAASLAWLEENEGFRRHLERYPRPSEDPEAALIYHLAPTADETAAEAAE